MEKIIVRNEKILTNISIILTYNFDITKITVFTL